MVLYACGPDAAGSSVTPWELLKARESRKPAHHVGVAGQRPEAELGVAVERRLVAQPRVERERVLVDGVVVRVVVHVAHR